MSFVMKQNLSSLTFLYTYLSGEHDTPLKNEILAAFLRVLYLDYTIGFVRERKKFFIRV